MVFRELEGVVEVEDYFRATRFEKNTSRTLGVMMVVVVMLVVLTGGIPGRCCRQNSLPELL